MSARDFSSGPWILMCDPPNPRITRMALVSTGLGRRAIDATGSGDDYAQDCANARAIAALPAVVAALEKTLNQLDALQSALGVNSDGRLNHVGLPPVAHTPAYRAARVALASVRGEP